MTQNGHSHQPVRDGSRFLDEPDPGAMIDAAATTSIVLVVWLIGAGITGLLAFLTWRR